MPFVTSSFLLLVVRHLATSSFLPLITMPGASSVLAPSLLEGAFQMVSQLKTCIELP